MHQPEQEFKKTILVTGGSGYVGSVFVDHYAKQHPGHQIIAIGRTEKPHLHFPSNVRAIQADYGNRDGMTRMLRENHVTQVVHMAANLGNDDPGSNVTKAAMLLDAMEDAGVNQIVYSSTFMVYDRPSAQFDGRLPEDFPTKQPSAKEYAGSKRAVEEMISGRKGLRSAVLRYAIAIGSSADHTFGDSRQSQGILTTYLKAARDSSVVDMPDDGSAARDFVDVQDIARANDMALTWIGQQKNPVTITLNVGTGEARSINQLIKAIEQVTGASIRLNRSPTPPGVLVSFLDSSLIRKTMHWEPKVTFEQSIENAWQFFTRQVSE